MKGLAHHRWSIESKKVWPDLKIGKGNRHYAEYWRRAELLPGGDLLAIWEYIGLARVDRDSRLKWASANGAHHDLAVAARRHDLRSHARGQDRPGDQSPRSRRRGFRDGVDARRERAPADLAPHRLRALRLRRRPRTHGERGRHPARQLRRHSRWAPRRPFPGFPRRQSARLVSEPRRRRRPRPPGGEDRVGPPRPVARAALAAHPRKRPDAPLRQFRRNASRGPRGCSRSIPSPR